MNSRPPLGLPTNFGAPSRAPKRASSLPTGQLLAGGAILAVLLILFIIGSTGGDEEAEAVETRVDLVEVVKPALTRAGYGDVRVESDGRTVTLSGELPTRTDVIAADAVVKSIAEVAFVVNNLEHPGSTEFDLPPATGDDAVVAGEEGSTAFAGTTSDSLILQARFASAAAREPIAFQTGSAELTPESATTISRIAQLMVDNPTVRIEVGGHTDSDGVAEENALLSQARADAVVVALVGQGVDGERLVAKGYGDTLPVASNETGEGKAQNRRIEFLLLL